MTKGAVKRSLPHNTLKRQDLCNQGLVNKGSVTPTPIDYKSAVTLVPVLGGTVVILSENKKCCSCYVGGSTLEGAVCSSGLCAVELSFL